MSDTMSVTQRNVMNKKSLKIAFLEKENADLAQMCEDLQTTLQINKNIIRSLLVGDKKQQANQGTAGNEYMLTQATQENEMLDKRLKTVTEERD